MSKNMNLTKTAVLGVLDVLKSKATDELNMAYDAKMEELNATIKATFEASNLYKCLSEILIGIVTSVKITEEITGLKFEDVLDCNGYVSYRNLKSLLSKLKEKDFESLIVLDQEAFAQLYPELKATQDKIEEDYDAQLVRLVDEFNALRHIVIESKHGNEAYDRLMAIGIKLPAQESISSFPLAVKNQNFKLAIAISQAFDSGK